MTDGIYITDDPDDITGCLEDALHKVIEAEPIERRLRREQLQQHGLEDYAQWVERLRAAEQVSAQEADILLRAKLATEKVVRVDDFTPQELANTAAAAGSNDPANEKPAVATAKAATRSVKKKATRKKAVSKKAVKSKAAAKSR